MGWLRLLGSLKLQVSFAKEPYKRDDILQKRPIILRSLLIVATPYEYAHLRPHTYVILPCKMLQCLWQSATHWMRPVTYMNESCHAYPLVCAVYERVITGYACEGSLPHIRMRHVTHVNESCHTYERVMSHISISVSCMLVSMNVC